MEGGVGGGGRLKWQDKQQPQCKLSVLWSTRRMSNEMANTFD